MAGTTDNVADYVIDQTDTALNNYVADTFANITSTTGPFLTALLTLYFIFVGYGIWTGKIQVNIAELISRSLKIATVLGLFLSWPIFSTLIVDILVNGPSALAAKMAGVSGGSVYSAVGDTFNTGMIAAGAAWSADGWVAPLLFAGIIIVIVCLQTAMALFLIILSKIALAVLIGVAPIFVLFLLFEPTRNMFTSWMQQSLNYCFIVILTVAVLLLTSEIFTVVIENVPNNPDGATIGNISPVLVVGLVSFMILKQVPSMASALAGGIQLSGTGALGNGWNAVKNRFDRRLNRPSFNRENKGSISKR